MCLTAPEHPAFHLPLPGQTPFIYAISLDRAILAMLAFGEFDNGFETGEMLDAALMFNHHYAGYSRSSRIGDLLTYEVAQDPRGRPRAERVAFSLDAARANRVDTRAKGSAWMVPLAVVVLGGLGVAWMMERRPVADVRGRSPPTETTQSRSRAASRAPWRSIRYK